MASKIGKCSNFISAVVFWKEVFKMYCVLLYTSFYYWFLIFIKLLTKSFKKALMNISKLPFNNFNLKPKTLIQKFIQSWIFTVQCRYSLYTQNFDSTDEL